MSRMILISDFGRIPKSFMDSVMIMSMMLPGTTIIYYGDEVKHVIVITDVPNK